MWQSIVDLVKSKKFKVMVFSVLGLVCAGAAGQMEWADVIDKATPLVIAYLAAQGIADVGVYLGKKDDTK